MINNPYLLLIVLLSVEIVVLFLAKHEKFKNYFKVLPAVFWIYFIPMVLSTAGLIVDKSPLYDVISKNVLPASLVLLLLGVDLKSVAKLGKSAVLMMLAGSAGIMIGIPIVFYFFKGIVGPEYWAGFGALSGSWIGGSANLVAVKESIGAPENVFLPMIVVDTVVPYVWLGVLVAITAAEAGFDRWSKADNKILEELHQKRIGTGVTGPTRFSFFNVILILAVAVAASLFAQQASAFLPEVKNMISSYAWTIIIVSTIGLAFSLTPLRGLEKSGSTDIGYFLLYLVLTSIGAKASLLSLSSAWILIIAGFCVVLVQAVVLIVAAKLLKAPLFLAAVSSQANIGGVASGPIVAEIYKPGLAYVGLLMAILGNIMGTYLGILTSQVCRWVASFP